MSDSTGCSPWYDSWWGKLLIGVGVIAILAIATIATAGIAGVGIGAAFGAGFAGAAIGAGASGLAVTIAARAFAGAVIGAGIGAVIGTAGAFISTAANGDWNNLGINMLNGAADGFMSGAITGALTGGMNGIFTKVTAAAHAISTSSYALKVGKFFAIGGAHALKFAGNAIVGGIMYMADHVPNNSGSAIGFMASLAFGGIGGYINRFAKQIWFNFFREIFGNM